MEPSRNHTAAATTMIWPRGARILVDEKKVRQGKDAVRSIGKSTPPAMQDFPVAGALRTAYENTMRETIPDEFMDLLGKLS